MKSTLARVASCKQSAGRCPIQIYPFVIWICRKWWSAGESWVCSKSSTEHRGELNYFHVHLASPIFSLIIFPHSQLQHLIKIDKVSSLSSSVVSSTSMPRRFSQAAAPAYQYYCRRHAPPTTAIFLAAPLHHPPQPQPLVNFSFDNSRRGQLYGEGKMMFMVFISSHFSNSQSIVYSLNNSATLPASIKGWKADWCERHHRSSYLHRCPCRQRPRWGRCDVGVFYSLRLVLIVHSHLFFASLSATINFGGSMGVAIRSTNQRWDFLCAVCLCFVPPVFG